MKDFIVVSEKGVVSGTDDPNKVMAMLMYAYQEVWNREVHEIDVMETAMKIMDLQQDTGKEDNDDDEMTFMEALKYILGDDEEE